MVKSWMKKAAALAAGMMLAACLGTAAWADQPKTIQENGLSIAGNTAGVQKDENGQLVISENGSYEITGTWKGSLENASADAPKAAICVADGVQAELVLKDVSISIDQADTFALAVEDGASVTCSLSGSNLLNEGADVGQKARLLLSGTGALDAGMIDGTGTFGLDASFQGVARTQEIICKKDTSGWNGILFEEEAGTVYGTPILSQNLTIDKGETLNISQNASLTVAKSVQVQNNGVVKNQGTIYNYGQWKGTQPEGNAPVTDAQIQVTLSASELTFADGLKITAVARVPAGTSNGTATFWMGEIGGQGVKLGTAEAVVSGQKATAELTVERCGADAGFTVGDTVIYVDFGAMTGEAMPGQSVGSPLRVTEITRSLPAPVVQIGTNLDLSLQTVVPSAGGGTVEYGVATENDASKVAKWQQETTFTGLTADTAYYVFARVSGDPEYCQAYSSTGPIVVPKASRTLSKPTATAKDVCRVEVSGAVPSAGSGVIEYGIATENKADKVTQWQTGTAFENLTADTTYYMFARVTGDTQYQDAISEGSSVTVKKAARTMNAPKGKAGGADSIVLEAAAPGAGGGTVEYGVCEKNDSNAVTNWQAGTTFTGLKAGTPYYCFARVKGDARYQDAVSQCTVIFTEKAGTSTPAPSNPGTYSIEVIAGEGGTVSPTSMQAAAGSNQTFTFTPKKGYEVANVRVDVTDFGSRTSYTFENVSGPHSLTVTFRPVKAASSSGSSSSDKSSSSSSTSSSSSSSAPVVSSSTAPSSSASSDSTTAPTQNKNGKVPTILLIVIALLVAAIAAVIIVMAVRKKKSDSGYEEYEEYPRYVDEDDSDPSDEYSELDMNSDDDLDDDDR